MPVMQQRLLMQTSDTCSQQHDDELIIKMLFIVWKPFHCLIAVGWVIGRASNM